MRQWPRRPFEFPRESPTRRGYGRRWEKLRRMVLARHPLCQIAVLCEGTALATEADHIIPKSKGGTDSMDNLQGACHACHSHKTATEDTAFAARPVQGDNPPFSTGLLAVRTAPEPQTHTREIDIGGVGIMIRTKSISPRFDGHFPRFYIRNNYDETQAQHAS